MRIKPVLLTALFIAACQNPTSAQTSEPAQAGLASVSDADIRCFLVTGKLAQTEETKQVGMMAGMYFMGKLMASKPTEADLEAQVRRVAPTLTDPATELRRCGAELQTSGAMTTRIGGRMTADGL